MEKIKLGIIGMGNMGAIHFKNILDGKCAEVDVTGVCDIDPARIEWAKETYGDLPVLCSGGVASNSLIRSRMEPLGAVFAPPQYSTDNALGVAILTHRAMEWGVTE